jgi:hypothetical protein
MSNTDTIGSLVIDLRANVAQLRVDMDAVKDTIAKSSREMSSQMKSDMNETRQVLAIMRDDFGIGVPRELRKVIASSELARTALLGMKDALFGLAFVNLGLEAFNKISEYIDKSSKAAAEEAKHTAEIAIAAEHSADATVKRREELELIGKGEEERHAIQKKFFDDELQQNKIRLAGLQGVLAARLAILASYDAQAKATPDIAADAEAGIDSNTGSGTTGLSASSGSAYSKFVQEHKAELDALNKAIDDANAGIKSNDLQLADFERGLGISRAKNAADLAMKDIEIYQDTIQKQYSLGKIGIDQELMGLRTAATEKYNIKQQELQDTLDILEKDPSRNKEKIEQIQTQLQLLWKDYEKTLTDIKAQGVAERKQLLDQQTAMEAAATKGLIDSNKDHGMLPGDLANFGSGKPQLSPDLIAAAVERFAGNFKDAAAQGKLLEKAMDDLLTPMDKFRVEQQEIELLKEKFKDYPEAVKALNLELLKANPEFQKLQEASAEFGKDLSNELDNILVKGESFHDFLVNIAKDIEEIALKALLLKPLEDFFSGKGSSGGGGGITGFLGSIFSGLHFADGGSPPVGQLSLVGENGPELFMPGTSGTIIPNGALGGDQYTFYIDAKGAAPGSEANIIRGLQRALEQTRRQSVAAAIDYQRRR